MNHLTLSAKITLGFALLLLIAAILGGIAVVSMKGVEDGAEKLAKVYVPEAAIGNNVERYSLLTMYDIRGYSMSEDKALLASGRATLAKVKSYLDEAKMHAQKFSLPALTKLEARARENVMKYEALVNETERLDDQLDEAKERMDAGASLYMRNSNDFLKGQNNAMVEEITKGVSKGKLQDRHEKITLINDIIDLGNDTRVNNFKYQSTGEMEDIKKAQANFPKMAQKIREIRKLTKRQADLDRLKEIEEGAAAYRSAIESYVEAKTNMDRVGKARGIAGDEVLSAAQETAKVAMTQTQEIADEASHDLATASATMIIGLIAAMVIGIVMAFLIIRSITLPIISAIRTIQDANNQVVSASNQIASSATNLAEGATRQASSVEEVSATIEESTALNTQNSDNAMQASKLARGANDAAEQGNVKVQDLMSSMTNITEASEKIAKIIKTIDEIAFQTNLLALNAAVEAARAGEHGLGFAVVADEVKNLAQRSADAAKETATIIQQAIDQIKHGNQIAQDTNESFSSILDQAKKTADIINEIAVSIKEQAEGMNQIATAITDVDEITQQNAAVSEEAAAASEEMNAQAIAMMESVEEVAKMVGLANEGKSSATRTSHLLEHKQM